MVYVIIEEVRFAGVRTTITKGVFKHKSTAEVAYMTHVKKHKEKDVLEDWLFCLDEVEEGVLHTKVTQLQYDGVWEGKTEHGVHEGYDGVAV